MIARELTQLTFMQGEEIEQLKKENKALKERDWEECCEEVKATLRKEIKILKQALKEKHG